MTSLFGDDATDTKRSVVVDVLTPVAVDTAYSYRAPASWGLSPGQFVAVPLGTRRAIGVVWSMRETGGDNLKSVAEPLPWPPLRKPLRDFVDWVSRWTLAPRGMVLRMARAGARSDRAASAAHRLSQDRQAAAAPHPGPRAAFSPRSPRAPSRRARANSPLTRAAARASSTGSSTTERSKSSRCRPSLRRRRSTPISPHARSNPTSAPPPSAMSRAVDTARLQRGAARRRHRLGQDGGLFRGDRDRAARRPAGARPAAGDRAHLAIPRPLRRPFRRAPGRMAFGDHAAPARAAVGRDGERRGACRRRRALGPVPALRGSRPHRRRRGARGRLQAGGRRRLSRPRHGGGARAARERGDRPRLRDALARDARQRRARPLRLAAARLALRRAHAARPQRDRPQARGAAARALARAAPRRRRSKRGSPTANSRCCSSIGAAMRR